MTLEDIVPGTIWHAQKEIRFGPLKLLTRATFVRLAVGGVWVHSPIPPSDGLSAQLDGIGPVRYVVAPNRWHHLFFRQFIERHPGAEGFIAPGLAEKIPDLAEFPVLDSAAHAHWSRDLDSVFVEGLPALNETVWFHRASGTLIVTDLLFCFAPDSRGLIGFVARLLGVHDRLAMSRAEKLMVRDRPAFARSVRRILDWDVKRIVLAHDQVIEDDAVNRLTAAFDWLLER